MKAWILVIAFLLVACTRPAEKGQHKEHAGHGAHKAKARIDPGPRRLSSVELDGDKAAAARALGPEQNMGEEILDPNGNKVFKMHDGRIFQGDLIVMRRPRVYAHSPMEAHEKKRDILKLLHSEMDHSEHRHCAQALYERSPPTERLSWAMVLHVTAKDGRVIIDDVEHVDAPSQVDQEARDCYVSAFRGIEHEWKGPDESSYLGWSVCINLPSQPAKGDAL